MRHPGGGRTPPGHALQKGALPDSTRERVIPAVRGQESTPSAVLGPQPSRASPKLRIRGPWPASLSVGPVYGSLIGGAIDICSRSALLRSDGEANAVSSLPTGLPRSAESLVDPSVSNRGRPGEPLRAGAFRPHRSARSGGEAAGPSLSRAADDPCSQRFRRLAAILATVVAMTVAGVPGQLAAQTNAGQGTRPNILVFISDDMGWGQAGFNGGTEITTTNLDRIADEGVSLTQFYAQPVCAPTRASLFTGRYAWKTGAGSNPDSSSDDGLLLDERTIAEALRDSGYATWLVGKWHLGHWGSERLPLQRGFEHHYGFYNGFIDSYKLLRPWRYWHEVFDWHRNGRPVVESGYSTFLLAEEASQLIERHNGSRPFFLYVAFNAPHDPYQAPREYIQQFRPSAFSADERKQRAMVKAMDDAIGQVMDTLDRKGVLDETLVMFLNDNGGGSEAGGNLPYRGLKRSYLEGGIRVPAVMRWPGRITAGSESDTVLHVSDLFPTFAGLAGADTDRGLPLDGFDAWDAIANGAESPREELVHSLTAIRVGDWKLIEEDGAFTKGSQSSPLQLYNIAEDPYETTNLASSETAKVAELRERLAYHGPFARDAQPGAAIPGLDEPRSLSADDRPVMFGEEENTAFGAEVETALTQREAGNLGPKLLWIEASGDQVKMVYDETLDTDSVPPADAFKVVVNPGYTSAEVTAVEVGESEVLLTLAQSVQGRETAGLTYEVPDTGAIRDVGGIAAVGVTWVTTLGAVFEGAPSAHDGLSSFKLQLWFSEPVSMSNSALQVTGGQIIQARQVNGSSELWELTMMPLGLAAVVLTLPATTDCAAAGAVCTESGKPMASRLEAVVPGPSLADVSITAAASPVTEGTVAVFNVSLSNAVLQVLTVAVSVTESGSMLSGTPPASVVFSPGDTSVTLSVPTAADSVVEADSVVTAAVAAGAGYSVGTASSATVTVEDDDAAEFTVSAAPAAIDEGESATLTVAIANGVTFAQDQTVALAVSGTASASDYTGVPAALALAAGASSATADLTASDDQEEEADETLTVEASLGGVSLGTATVTIASVSHDATLSALSLSGIDIGTFSSTVTSYAASVGHGVESATVTATASHPEAEVSIAPGAEVSLAEGANQITVTGTAEDGTTTQAYTVTVTRAGMPEVSIAAVSSAVTEGEAAAFDVRLAEAAFEALTVAVSVTEGGSMLSGTPPASVAFSKGDTSVTLSVPTAGDLLVEADSAVTALVAAGTGYRVGQASSATVTVEDDDAAEFTVSAAPAAIDEGGSATLTVAIANGVTFAQDQTVALAVTGTASASDYTVVPAALALAAGASSATADLTASDDQEEEADETLTVEASLGGVSIGAATVTIASVSHDATLSALSLSGIDIGTFSSTVTSYAASVGHGVESATVTATASHPEAEVSIAPGAEVSLAEGANQITVTGTAEDGTTTQAYTLTVTRAAIPVVSIVAVAERVSEADLARFTVSRTGPTAQPLDVKVRFASTTSTRIQLLTVRLSPGQESVTRRVQAGDNTIVEDDVTVTWTLAAGEGYTVSTENASASVVLEENDAPEFAVSVEPAEIAEGETATVRVAITNGVTFRQAETITLAVSGTASATDYSGVPAMLTLDAYTTSPRFSATATLTAAVDEEEEAAETVTITASHNGSVIGSATVTINSVSHDASLATLSLSGIDIGTFSGATTSYQASVEQSVETTTVTATANHSGASVSIDPGSEVSLAAGANRTGSG